jgi:RNA polymerase sigma-70 factor (ECF subfamily)
MARVAARDEGAFALLVGRLRGPALRLAARVLGDPVEGEDAVQAALIKLWNRADAYDRERGGVESWFARMVVNCCLDRRRTIRPVAPLEAAGDPQDDRPGPEDAAEADDEGRRVREAIGRLNPRQRAAILLFYGEDAPTADVAAALETTPKAVEGLLARARGELKRMLDDMRTAC